LSNGVVPGTANPAVTAALQPERVRAAAAQFRPAAGGLELDLVHDYKLIDGRYAPNSWLPEPPEPITQMTWGNVAQIGPGMAKQMEIANGDLLLLTISGRSVQMPAWIQPGHSDEAVTVSLGYGRKQRTLGVKDADEPGVVGHDVYPLRSSTALWFAPGLDVKKVGRSDPLSHTQVQSTTEGPPIALMQTVEDYERHPDAPEYGRPVKVGSKQLEGSELPSVQASVDYSKQQYKWAMSVDMSRCTGCSACVIACQAENNIPVVGKYQVGRGREMQWIRMD